MFEVKNKDTRMTSGIVLVFLLLTLNIFHTLLFSIVNLEQVNLVSIFCLAFNMSHLRLSRNKFWEPFWFQNVPKETYFIVVKFYKNCTKHPVFIKKILQWKNLLPSPSYAKDWGVAVLFNHFIMFINSGHTNVKTQLFSSLQSLNFQKFCLRILLFSNFINNMNVLCNVTKLTSQSWLDFVKALFFNEVSMYRSLLSKSVAVFNKLMEWTYTLQS